MRESGRRMRASSWGQGARGRYVDEIRIEEYKVKRCLDNGRDYGENHRNSLDGPLANEQNMDQDELHQNKVFLRNHIPVKVALIGYVMFAVISTIVIPICSHSSNSSGNEKA
ncbi:hypothetical protein Sjap_025815 [Stephania japonica]|uniref:Transmembrane protein n=1 Tax=Stephania japonica TaxID=461633 RepID=A0AAP0EA82_9MAGN